MTERKEQTVNDPIGGSGGNLEELRKRHKTCGYTIGVAPVDMTVSYAWAYYQTNEQRLNRKAQERQADALERIATVLEAADDRGALDESVKIWGTH